LNDTAKKVRAITALGLEPSLKEAGFRKGGTHFSKGDREALQVVDVQSSQWNTGASGKFTLNAGVHFSSVAKMLHGIDPMPSAPKEYYCVLRRRVGMLLPAGTDKWWAVTPKTDAESVAAELSLAWKDYIWPWLERVRTIPGAAEELENGRGGELWAAAAARLVLGEREKAGRLVEKMIEVLRTDRDAAHPANADLTAKHLGKIQQWAIEHGLDGFVKA
jgi:uncharacterized protein DUF4304